MPGTSQGSVERLRGGGGWGQEAPGHQNSMHWPSVTCCSDTKSNSRVGGGTEVSLPTCQELKGEQALGVGTEVGGGRIRRRAKDPREGINLGEGPGALGRS